MQSKNYTKLSFIVGFLLILAGLSANAQPVSIEYFDYSVSVVAAGTSGQLITNGGVETSPSGGEGFFISSPADGSGASASAFATYSTGSAYTLFGSGSVRFTGGDYDGDPSQLAGGQSSSYALIEVRAPLRYSFSASCDETGSQIAAVDFDGSGISGAGQAMLARGTFSAGSSFSVIAECVNGANSVGGSASWNYTLELNPIQIQPQFTSIQEQAFSQSSQATATSAQQLLVQAFSTPIQSLAESLAGAFAALSASAQFSFEQSLDPLDTNYDQLAQITVPPITPLIVASSVTQTEANAYNVWVTNLAWSAAYASAWSTSVNRAQGATFAGNAYWSTLQMNTAAQFEAQLAFYLDQEPTLRSNVVAQFQAGGFEEFDVTSNEVVEYQTEIASNGFPADVLAGLANSGIDGNDVTNILANFVAANQTLLATNFPLSLVNTNLDAAQHAMAGSLRDASLVLINSKMLPNGQLRFDLPTEIGYTYKVQFTTNLSNPASWTTLLNTNATTALLSFTNSSGAGAPPGYFRATHN